jgi:hypothetical protein
MTDKKKMPAKKSIKKASDNGISEQLAIVLAAYKPQVGEKKFKSILKKTAKQIIEGIVKAEKKNRKTIVVKKKVVAKKVAVKKKAAPKKVKSK